MGSERHGELVEGTVVAGRYRIVGRLSQGGMGEVYEVEHAELGRRLALKLLRSDLASDGAVVERFRNEAIVSSRIRHPNLVESLDIGTTDSGQWFYVMELIEGETLSARLERGGRLEPRLAIDIATQVARGLALAHASNVVHRDLKPANVMLSGPRDAPVAKVLDFGVARITVNETSINMTGQGLVVGTPRYMAPEQVALGKLDCRTDVYALGLILYEMLTGKVVFEGSASAVMVQHLNAPPPALPSSVPDGLRRLVKAMLAKLPDDRPRDMGEVVRRLSRSNLELEKVDRTTTRLPLLPPPAPRAPTRLPRSFEDVELPTVVVHSSRSVRRFDGKVWLVVASAATALLVGAWSSAREPLRVVAVEAVPVDVGLAERETEPPAAEAVSLPPPMPASTTQSAPRRMGTLKLRTLKPLPEALRTSNDGGVP